LEENEMALARIATVEGMMAILLPPDMAEQSGLQIGDNVDVAINDRSLIITRILSAEERAKRIRASTKEILHRRADAYRALAQIEES